MLGKVTYIVKRRLLTTYLLYCTVISCVWFMKVMKVGSIGYQRQIRKRDMEPKVQIENKKSAQKASFKPNEMEKNNDDELEKNNDDELEVKKEEAVDKKHKNKFGSVPSFQHQTEWTRAILLVGALAVALFGAKRNQEVVFARRKEVVEHRHQYVTCSEDYKAELVKFAGCAPKNCGRLVSDVLVTEKEAKALLDIATQGISLGGSEGGASILDLHSGALSMGRNFINIYHVDEAKDLFQKLDLTVYRAVKRKIQTAVADYLGVKHELLYLTHPTFFSRLNAAPALTVHDEYWHPHVDKETYASFHYTSLLYLTDYGIDFQGGRFVFVDKDNVNRTVEPRKGRVLMFTSGSENVHFVERVTSGTRFAITVSFTCDPKYAIDDPILQYKEDQS